MTIYTPGDVVRSEVEIGSSGGVMPPVPPGIEGIVVYVYPEGAMRSPWDGRDYALKVKFPGFMNLCRCLDGCYHVGDFEVSKVEATDEDIKKFIEGAEPEAA